jgi:uncharacterized protein (TIGR00251 family)
MKITIQVKPNSRKEGIEELPDGSYLVKVNAPPVEGKANERVVELLSEKLGKSKSSFTLVSGHKSKRKVFEIS